MTGIASNRSMLLACVEEAGCVPVDLGIARDTEESMREVISAGLDRCDVIVSSGSVSMGMRVIVVLLIPCRLDHSVRIMR